MADRETVMNSITSKSQCVHPLVSEACISRVPRRLRKVNEEAYTPQIVSLGPYHHGNERLRPMEEHKLRYLSDLFLRGSKNSYEVFVDNLIELEEGARKFYEQPVMYDSNSFVEMMLLDGCFIIELIIKEFEWEGDVGRDPLFRNEFALSSIKYDMLLLENQLPFFVLERLFILFTGPSDQDLVEAVFLKKVFSFFSFHYHLNMAQDVPRIKVNNDKTKHFLDLCRDFCVPPIQEPSGYVPSRKSTIPCATELQEAGVKFKGGMGNGIFGIRFAANGVLEIPIMNVHENTEVLLRSLIAYEQCFVQYEYKYISLYVYLMDLLLNSPADVATLGGFGVIDNFLDKDQVSHIFNNISKGTIIDVSSYYYSAICNDLNYYYNTPRNKFRAMLLREYFYSPWSTASSVAVMIVVLCTIIQTLCSVMSVGKGA